MRADPSVFEVARLPDHSAAGLYALACVPELMDAVIHIDYTDAVVPLDMTNEWRRGRAEAGAQQQAGPMSVEMQARQMQSAAVAAARGAAR